jgi:hypothetical protein
VKVTAYDNEFQSYPDHLTLSYIYRCPADILIFCHRRRAAALNARDHKCGRQLSLSQ